MYSARRDGLLTPCRRGLRLADAAVQAPLPPAYAGPVATTFDGSP